MVGRSFERKKSLENNRKFPVIRRAISLTSRRIFTGSSGSDLQLCLNSRRHALDRMRHLKQICCQSEQSWPFFDGTSLLCLLRFHSTNLAGFHGSKPKRRPENYSRPSRQPCPTGKGFQSELCGLEGPGSSVSRPR